MLLRNRFRRLVGYAILLVMGIAVMQYFRMTSGNKYVAGALWDGLKLLLLLAVVLWLVYRYDRRQKKRDEQTEGGDR